MQTETATTTTTTTTAPAYDERAAMLHALRRFINSRPGFEPANYCGAPAAYRADSRRAQRDRRDALTMLDAVIYCDAIGAGQLRDAFRGAFSGRLLWDPDRRALSYCAGQYYPTEYRAAACAVLASALWAHWRDTMPAPMWWRAEGPRDYSARIRNANYAQEIGPWRDSEAAARADLAAMAPDAGGYRGSIREGYGSKRETAGDYLRREMRERFGRSIAARWFN